MKYAWKKKKKKKKKKNTRFIYPKSSDICFPFHASFEIWTNFVKARKDLQLLIIWDLLAGQISCSVKLSMKKKI